MSTVVDRSGITFKNVAINKEFKPFSIDAGFEVIYMGLHNVPEQIVECALQEDADAIGLSILSGAHRSILPRIYSNLKEKGLKDLPIVVGGIIPEDDIELLKQNGVKAVFTPGSNLNDIVDTFRMVTSRTV